VITATTKELKVLLTLSPFLSRWWFTAVHMHWFHGFPREKAKALRLRALAKLLRYCYAHGVGTVVFENLYDIKKRRLTKSRTANRKMSKFAKRELLRHAIVMSLKYGFRVLLVDPKGTTSSGDHDEIMKRCGLDGHSASAYLIALRARNQSK